MISPNRGENKKYLKPPPSYLHESHKSKPNVGKYSIRRAIWPYCAVLYQLWLWKIVSIVAPRIFHISAGMAGVNKKSNHHVSRQKKTTFFWSGVFFFRKPTVFYVRKGIFESSRWQLLTQPVFLPQQTGQMNVTPLNRISCLKGYIHVWKLEIISRTLKKKTKICPKNHIHPGKFPVEPKDHPM